MRPCCGSRNLKEHQGHTCRFAYDLKRSRYAAISLGSKTLMLAIAEPERFIELSVSSIYPIKAQERSLAKGWRTFLAARSKSKILARKP